MPRKKKFIYELTDLVSEYNEDLYNEVAGRISVKLVKDIKAGWSATIVDGEAIITYRKSASPDACFAHELLHIKYELNGLKPPTIIDNEGVMEIIRLLFNQICHHKFYNEFYDLGFDENEFLNDNDAFQIDNLAKRDIKTLEEIFSENGEIEGSIPLLLPYIMLKSPHDNSESTQLHIERIKKIGDKSFFESIDRILADWIKQESMDSSLTFARIFKSCNRPNVGFCLSGRIEDIILAGNI